MRAIEFTAFFLENRRRFVAYLRDLIWITLKSRGLQPRYDAMPLISARDMSLRSPDVADQLRAFEEMCREKGFPLTVQRRVILECVLQRHDHPTADQVHEEVRARVPEISRTTVYRTLETLVQMGAIRRAHHLGPASRFDANTHHHHHLVCMRCNCVADFEDPRLDQLPVPDETHTSFRIVDYSVHYAGLCAACQKAERDAS